MSPKAGIIGVSQTKYEAVLQVRGEAGDRQVQGARIALAQGYTGYCGQGQYVMIVGA